MNKMSCEIENCIVWDQDKRSSFAEHDLIMPDISIGNVGQLTVDLLLNNLEIEPIGRIVHACFYPFIGSDPFKLDSTRLASSCEIYECKEKKLIILQIRSRVFPSKFEEFKDLLIQFIKQFDFKQTILLASSSSEYFSAEQLYGVPVHYLKTTKFGNKEVFGHLRWKLFAFPDNIDTSIVSPVPGSFVSKDLLENCEKEDIALVVIICICSEGDNRPEALQMMNCLNAWLCLRQGKKSGESWTKPLSWKSPYGSSAPYTIY